MPDDATAEDAMKAVAGLGGHILVRDAAWRVSRVDRTSSGARAIHAVGLFELDRGNETLFLEDYEEQFGREIQVLDPRTKD